MIKIKVNLKKMGKKKNSIDPVLYTLENNPKTVKELIEETVKTCVKEYSSRQENVQLLKNLTQKEIDDKATSGKVSFGVNYGDNTPNLDEAIANAYQSFEDGIYRIILDNKPLTNINEEIELTKDCQLTFIRLTMLTGRMW